MKYLFLVMHLTPLSPSSLVIKNGIFHPASGLLVVICVSLDSHLQNTSF